jgi:hypothetical protein
VEVVEVAVDVDVDVPVWVEVEVGLEGEVEVEVEGGPAALKGGAGVAPAPVGTAGWPVAAVVVGSSVVPLVTSVIWTSLPLAVFSAPAGVPVAVPVAGVVVSALAAACLRWGARRARVRRAASAALRGCACSLTTTGSPLA